MGKKSALVFGIDSNKVLCFVLINVFFVKIVLTVICFHSFLLFSDANGYENEDLFSYFHSQLWINLAFILHLIRFQIYFYIIFKHRISSIPLTLN